ncbi:type II secretion system F family protein [Caballeronia sordidicola]|uniref:Type II/IV secretion system protein TadC, associated with Flp pilus assembly n=1 Tax=Caballeronia sordidicola TaxID=196367 RepID=A0A242N6R8_CABSO|nr:type II secretion system F family protein [Caballeronia sordidicola]OTP79283.1 Type II/IV secretion system protein TadC, associated with Flp pilus assembly [Caballeronia sordidicola]
MSPENTQTLINLLMLLALFAALAIWWQTKHGGNRGRIAERARLAVRNQQLITAPEDEVVEEEAFKARLVRRLGALGEKLPLFDAKYRAKLQRDMVQSGYRSQSAASVLLSVKFCFGLAAAAVTIMMGTHLPVVGPYPLMRGVAMLGAFIVGMMIPEYAVSFRSSRRKKRMAGSLPDALDLLVICTNAGNSLAVSIRRVADELATICPPLSEEFMLTADELKLSGDSTRALMSLGERIDLPSIRALISTLTQSMRYGTPITQALRTLSRTERLQHIVSLEEKAAKLAPKMVLPMMLFILPAVVAVAAGPAVIQLMDFLHK